MKPFEAFIAHSIYWTRVFGNKTLLHLLFQCVFERRMDTLSPGAGLLLWLSGLALDVDRDKVDQRSLWPSCIHHIWVCGVFFRWLNKLVVLPCGADTTLWHSLHTTSFWSTSLALNPKNLHTIDVDPLRGTSSSRCCRTVTVCFRHCVSLSHC